MVGDEHDGRTVGLREQPVEVGDEQLAAGEVHPTERLVEEQQLRLEAERTGDAHPLPLTLAERVDAPIARWAMPTRASARVTRARCPSGPEANGSPTGHVDPVAAAATRWSTRARARSSSSSATETSPTRVRAARRSSRPKRTPSTSTLPAEG
jgi:hypothetical protein